jgi:carbohydrate-binding DOMON domain-containing protein
MESISPGTWVANERGEVCTANDGVAAPILVPAGGFLPDTATGREQVANATVAAAAPDLLEALKQIAKGAPINADFAEGGRYDYPSNCGNAQDAEELGRAAFHLWAGRLARAAIAKAEGDER